MTVPRPRWEDARRRSLALARDWRRSGAIAMLADVFDDRAAADLGIARDRAERLMRDGAWIAELLRPLTAALAADPLFEAPFKVHRAGGRIGAALFDSPAARIGASVIAVDARAAPATSVVVPGYVSVTRYVRAGGVRLRRWRAEAVAPGSDGAARAIEIPAIVPRDGETIVEDGRTAGHVTDAADGAIVTVTAVLRAGAAPVMREFAVADGAPIRTATTDDGASRGSMLLTLLRVSGRADAGGVFDAATRDPARHVRWQAMREWLALDASAALVRLADMARDDDDAEIRRLADGTLAMAARRRATCPA